MKKQKKDPLYKSFGYAFHGIFTCVTEGTEYEDSLCGGSACCDCRIVILNITAIEWCICMILFGLVMALEHGEYGSRSSGRYGDRRYNPLAKVAKDTAAGAVLIAAIMAAIAGMHYIFSEASADIAVIQFGTSLSVYRRA